MSSFIYRSSRVGVKKGGKSNKFSETFTRHTINAKAYNFKSF